MTPRPGRLVLLGHPVAHSLSPTFQNAALQAAGIPLVYEALDVEPAGLAAVVDRLVAERTAGNVTIPHKAAMLARCATVTPVAARAGAVNTFWVDDRGQLQGDNTDVGGFDAAVGTLLGETPRGVTVALLGAGGAAGAVLAAVERWPHSSVRLWSRRHEAGVLLAGRFGAAVTAHELLAEAIRNADLVVNATPIGLADDAIPFPVALVRRQSAVLDLVYRRGGTAWIRAARTRGLRAMDGLPMLLEQGALAFERWFGVAPDRAAMRASVS